MLASSGEPFDSSEHFFEVKWDGIRALAYRDGDSFWMETRNFKQALPRFPELATVKRSIKSDAAVIDGEIVVPGSDGLPDFDTARARNAQKLPAAIAQASVRTPAVFIAFDCLVVDGKEIMAEAFARRRETLITTIDQTDRIVVTHGVLETGRAYFDSLCDRGLEGMVAKALASPYKPGTRSKDWIKVRNVRNADCVVGGFIPKGKSLFKSLLVGLYDDAGAFRFMGHVGTGFDSNELTAIRGALERLRSDACPFESITAVMARDALWVRPRLVCRIEYLTLTQHGHLRHPTFQGIRTDKSPEDCLLAAELGAAPIHGL